MAATRCWRSFSVLPMWTGSFAATALSTTKVHHTYMTPFARSTNPNISLIHSAANRRMGTWPCWHPVTVKKMGSCTHSRQCTHTNLRTSSTHNNLIQICILHTQKIQRKSRDKLQIWTLKLQVSTIYFSSTLSLHKLSFSSGVLTIECPPKSSIGMYYVDCSLYYR